MTFWLALHYHHPTEHQADFELPFERLAFDPDHPSELIFEALAKHHPTHYSVADDEGRVLFACPLGRNPDEGLIIDGLGKLTIRNPLRFEVS